MAKLTNEQKYRTAEERVKAHDEYCGNRQECQDQSYDKCVECFAHWLAIEAEEEKPDPCFFCGGETVKAIKVGGAVVECKCGYHTRFYNTTEIAIAAHNRVARAVRATKESEVK